MSKLFHSKKIHSIFSVIFISSLLGLTACNHEDSSEVPEITILGENPVSIEQGATYMDAGATASDAEDGDLTASIITNDQVDTSIIGNYEVTYTVTDSDNNKTTKTRIVSVTAPGVVLPKSLNQAAFNGSAYVYGFDSINNVTIYNAPADTDRDRWAMLHDGARYRLYFFKLGSADTMYQFAFNPSTSRYEYGFDSVATIKITGMPADADTSSFAMLHDGTRYRLYMKSATNSKMMYQAAWNGSSYAYGFGSINILYITGAPVDADFSRWAMLHAGSRYRMYIFKNASDTTIYQFAFNPSTTNYEYGFDSINTLTVTGMPVTSDTGNMAMLHDGARYRFYFQTQ